MSWYYHDTAFPCSQKLKHTLAYTPHAHGSLCRSPSAPLTTFVEPRVSCGVTRMAITVPRAPSPPWGVTPPRVVFHDLGQHYPAFIATTDSCARPLPSRVLRTMAWSGSLCRLPRAPAGRRSFPMLSPQSVWRCLDPYPAALLRCACPFLPEEPRPHLTCKRFGAQKLPP